MQHRRYSPPRGACRPNVEPASAIRTADYRVIAIDQKVLLIGTWPTALLAIPSIAVLVGGRMAEQTRRVGLLKAAGATPAFVGSILLAENVALAVVAGIGGLILGSVLAPSLASPGDGLISVTPTPSLTVSSDLVVMGIPILVAVGATLAPAIRAARTSTLGPLDDRARPPHRRPRLIALSAALPVPMLLAVRLVARRTRRTVLTAASLTLAVTMVVAALTVQRQLDSTKTMPRQASSQALRSIKAPITFCSCSASPSSASPQSAQRSPRGQP